MITVLLPTYNAGKYLSLCIRSILNQTYKDFELLIIDSASSDNTVEIVRSFSDERISLHCIERCSLSDSLNYGLKTAKYDLIARMDADDLMMPERLEVQFAYLKEHPQVNVLSCSYFCYRKRKLLFPVILPENDVRIKQGLALHNVICHPGSFFLRNFILDNGGYSNGPAEDYELWLRLKSKGIFANVPGCLLFVSFEQDSLSRSNKQFAEDVYKLQQNYYNSFEQSFPEIPKENRNEISGWREFFYGQKAMARKHWSFSRLGFYGKLAYIISFLPDAYFKKMLRSRLSLSLRYISRYYSSEYIMARKTFNKLIAEPVL